MIYLIVSVRFHAIGSAPILKQRVFKISASSRFSVVLNFLRKKVGVREGDGLFCYVNSVFAPGLDEGVGNLYRVRILSALVPAPSIGL
jgi:ubiquitin-like protein ATG12